MDLKVNSNFGIQFHPKSWIQTIDAKCDGGHLPWTKSLCAFAWPSHVPRRGRRSAGAHRLLRKGSLLHALLRSAFIAHPKKPVLENTLFFRGHNISAPPVFESSLCLSWSPRRPWLLCGVPRRGSGRRSPCRRRLQGCRCRRCRTAAIGGAPSIAGLQVASPIPPLHP